VPHELPNVACFNVDLPGPGIAGELADDVVVKILSEFSGQKQTEVVAYRGRHRWERRYKPVTLRAPAPAAQDAGGSTAEGLRERGVYLITGGTGGIGLAFAKHLARTCRARIVLTKKAAFPEKSEWRRTLDSKLAAEGVLEIIKELHEIERLGAEVQVLVADASDHDQMRRAVNETLGKYQTIHGVFHAAGIVAPRPIGSVTRLAAEEVLAPKVQGTWVLFDLLQDVKLDFMVLFSSMSSVTGPYAHADYAAANCFLDAFAEYANSRSKFRTLSINWPVWREVGIGAGTSYFAQLEALLGVENLKEEMLKRAMSTDDGLRAFARALSAGYSQVIVSPENLDSVIDASKAVRADAQGSGAKAEAAGNRRCSVDQPTNEIEANVAKIWCDVFGHEQIGVRQEFSSLGGHSLIAMQIVAKVRSFYQIDLSLREFFAAPSVAGISAVVERKILREIEDLSDEEAGKLVQSIRDDAP
jgi:NAD(P)-dependent dehydrogenase (short-subunit alcohol dehydrogenase family)/acyl carrier protein